MDGDIVFYIHGDTIEYGGELFSAGELTADILNLSFWRTISASRKTSGA